MKPYTVESGYDDSFKDGDYEYYGVYDRNGDVCALFYVDAVPNAKHEAEAFANYLNRRDEKHPKNLHLL